MTADQISRAILGGKMLHAERVELYARRAYDACRLQGEDGIPWDEIPEESKQAWRDLFRNFRGQYLMERLEEALKWERRCPHDGESCHHRCPSAAECTRERQGMRLTAAHEGYPLPGYGPAAAMSSLLDAVAHQDLANVRTVTITRIEAGRYDLTVTLEPMLRPDGCFNNPGVTAIFRVPDAALQPDQARDEVGKALGSLRAEADKLARIR